jgi:hypothetical protein
MPCLATRYHRSCLTPDRLAHRGRRPLEIRQSHLRLCQAPQCRTPASFATRAADQLKRQELHLADYGHAHRGRRAYRSCMSRLGQLFTALSDTPDAWRRSTFSQTIGRLQATYPNNNPLVNQLYVSALSARVIMLSAHGDPQLTHAHLGAHKWTHVGVLNRRRLSVAITVDERPHRR